MVLNSEDFVIELRVPNAGKNGTISGYFNDMDKLAEAAAKLSGTVPGVYITLNPVNPDLLARSANKIKNHVKHTTNDSEILFRYWLPIDLDPKRSAGISSTDNELAAADDRALKVFAWLKKLGWSDPIRACSGNGTHLLYRIDLPNNENSTQLVKQVLDTLDLYFSDKSVGIDTTVYNAARIWKLYGTKACKGDDIPDRPHRMAKLLEVPQELAIVCEDQLNFVAALCPKNPSKLDNFKGGQMFDLDNWIREKGLPIQREGPWNGGRKWVLDTCPFNPDHTDKAAYIVQLSNGAIAAGCHHNGCQGLGWPELREIFEPGYRDNHKRCTPKRFDLPPYKENQLEGKKTFPLTDLGNAERLVTRHGKDLRFCHSLNKWAIWAGTHWQIDNTGEIERRAKDTVRSIYTEAATIETQTLREATAKHAAKSESNRAITAMIELAKTESGIPVLPEKFDSDIWVLNCQNGTLDLKTGELRLHSRNDLLTKCIPIIYNPSAKAVKWVEFLDQIMQGNQNLISFLQKAVGYSLTGSASEQCLFLLHGSGANGKSTFLEVIDSLLGQYAKHTETNALMQKDMTGGASSDIAKLAGARFVVASEVEEGKRLAESLVKQITGGEKISARFLYSEHFEFTPQFKLWLGTNHKPNIRGVGNAIWRRIRLIPFTVSIPPEEQDRNLPEKLREELPGILNWAVKGCLQWQQEGLGIPDEVKAATDSYRMEMDKLGTFIDESCIAGNSYYVQSRQLYNAYIEWCKRNEEYEISQTKFSLRLIEKGFTKLKSGGIMVWKGIYLCDTNKNNPFTKSYIVNK